MSGVCNKLGQSFFHQFLRVMMGMMRWQIGEGPEAVMERHWDRFLPHLQAGRLRRLGKVELKEAKVV